MQRLLGRVVAVMTSQSAEIRRIVARLAEMRRERQQFLQRQEREGESLEAQLLLISETENGNQQNSDIGASGSKRKTAGEAFQKSKRSKPKEEEMFEDDDDLFNDPLDEADISIGTQQESKVSWQTLGLTVEDGWVQVWTDGACSDNQHSGRARAGVGVWWTDGSQLNISERVVGGKQTNNVAEIQAGNRAVGQAIGLGIKKLQVNTDSMFLINCATKWMAGWKKNGWINSQKKPVINKDDLLPLDKMLQSGKLEVQWNYVKGHANNRGNNEADKLAVAGAKK